MKNIDQTIKNVDFRRRFLNAQARCVTTAVNSGNIDLAIDLASTYSDFEKYFCDSVDWFIWDCKDFDEFVRKAYKRISKEV